MACMSFALLFTALLAAASAADVRQAQASAANPVRKVVTMLQAMQKKVQEEGEKEKKLYDKFVCYCRTSGGDLQQSIATAQAKVPSVGSEIKEAESQKIQLEEDLKQHQSDRSAAKTAMEEATAIREKEAAAFAEEKAMHTANIQALDAAVAAISRGMAGSFLQTNGAKVLRTLVASQDMLDMDRQTLLSFLSGTEGYVPKGGEVVGILKELGAEMSKSLADATATEDAAIKNYEDLMAAKKREAATLTQSIEVKMKRGGELAVEIVQMKDDLSDTEEALLEDQKFLADLDSSCDKKKGEWEERVKTRAEELATIAETIEILNSDDALELFKKTLPSPSASFVQVHARGILERKHALSVVQEAIQRYRPGRADMDFLAMALQGRKIGFEKVFKMIDDMVAILKKEQTDDEHKQEYCQKQFDTSEDELKGLERTASDLETAIANAEEAIGTTVDEIKVLEKTIKELDKTVAEATEQRKAEHEDFTALMASNTAAKELLMMAKNRLHKFYNPRLHVPESTAAPDAAVFAEVSSHLFRKESPPPPPETFGAYHKKSDSTGVIAMLDLLVKDLDKEMTEAETMEENSQKDYEGMMKDSAEKRAQSSKSLTLKSSMKASLETDVQAHKESQASNNKEIAAMTKYISTLHTECDWLLKYFDVRKEARAGEIDSLNQAKAILSGADFALIETRARGLRGSA
uniref:Uncharacterized protein n=1 Tax=Alexandrium monilatum TaxID=311494 RepID=A0A7S4QK26_9DINO|mmetsp:Transcript_79706/g.248327  ORF Transcript_79706/g.248327 Transcript_79706/m.248327 type:complete len:694 (+) Transcript_79706:68-2149(+)